MVVQEALPVVTLEVIKVVTVTMDTMDTMDTTVSMVEVDIMGSMEGITGIREVISTLKEDLRVAHLGVAHLDKVELPVKVVAAKVTQGHSLGAAVVGVSWRPCSRKSTMKVIMMTNFDGSLMK